MEGKINDPFGIESLMMTWTASMNDAMEVMSKTWSAFPGTAGDGGNDAGESGPMEAMAAAFKNWQTIASAMTTPESMASFIKGTETLPEICAHFAQAVMDSLSELQQKMGKSAASFGESVDSYKFKHMDESGFHIWTDIYKKEFQKFFQIPQLGLTREYQERINAMADKFNLFQADHAEFLRLLSLPFQQAAAMMQKDIADMAEKGELPEDSQVYYQMWIKMLEGHFMTLFQTPEYVQTLAKTLGALSEFSRAKNAVLEDMLQGFPVAKESEMDELARDLYELKKRVTKLERENRELKSLVSADQGCC
ncbi:MAG: hypothetical protein HUN04_19935 [Desulfobacter sp.]|nr:MAG: hypothetical protein HUN04_19935 [Desulfobacter sp.]